METIAKEKEVKTAEKANGKAKETAAFIQNNPVNKESVKPEPVNSSETVTGALKPEPIKKEMNPGTPTGKGTLNLDSTLRLVEELHRKKIQREKLLETINNLESFEFDLKDEADETDGNHFQGCTLTIVDDNRNTFATKNPTIIWTVAQMVNRLCVDKLAEIEAAIVIPA